MPVTQTFYFWRNEEIGASPATSVKEVYFDKLISATLTVDVNLYNLWHLATFQSVYFNGSLLPGSSGPEGAHRTYDVTDLVRSGANTVVLNYWSTWAVGPWGVATVYLTITAEKISTPMPPLEWWQWLLIGGIGLVVAWGIVSYFAKK
jgi:hypothetical protein